MMSLYFSPLRIFTMKYLERMTDQFQHLAPLIDPMLFDRFQSVDLSKSKLPGHADPVLMNEQLAAYLATIPLEGVKTVLYGGYLEERNLYGSSGHFSADIRNIHLGVDLWLDPGTAVFASTDGVVHSMKYCDQLLDYGYCLVVEYPEIGYVLYGHLDDYCMRFRSDDRISKGEKIAQVGPMEVNGGWVPHLHLQVIRDMEGGFGDYPGVCSRSKLAHYQANCPDPKFLFLM